MQANRYSLVGAAIEEKEFFGQITTYKVVDQFAENDMQQRLIDEKGFSHLFSNDFLNHMVANGRISLNGTTWRITNRYNN